MALPRTRWLVVGVGGALALAPMACTAGRDSAGVDLPDTTPFRTSLVEVVTTTTAPPTTAPPPTKPGETTSSVVTGPGGTYVVQPGDAWYLIASNAGVTIEALLTANGATPETAIHPGNVLQLPAGAGTTSAPDDSAPETAPTGEGGTYTVVAGDYWIGIADKLNVDFEDLLAANDATADTHLTPGQVINVPG